MLSAQPAPENSPSSSPVLCHLSLPNDPRNHNFAYPRKFLKTQNPKTPRSTINFEKISVTLVLTSSPITRKACRFSIFKLRKTTKLNLHSKFAVAKLHCSSPSENMCEEQFQDSIPKSPPSFNPHTLVSFMLLCSRTMDNPCSLRVSCKLRRQLLPCNPNL